MRLGEAESIFIMALMRSLRRIFSTLFAPLFSCINGIIAQNIEYWKPVLEKSSYIVRRFLPSAYLAFRG